MSPSGAEDACNRPCGAAAATAEPPRRVLMIAPTPFFADRGCHVRIYEELHELSRRGHAVELCTYHHGGEAPGVVTRRIPRIPWYRKLEAGPSWHKLYLDLLLLILVIRRAWKFRPDVLYAHLHEGAFIGYFASKLFRLPLIFDYQGSLAGEILDHGFVPRSSLRHRLFQRVEAWIEKRADVAVANGAAAAERMRQKNTFRGPIVTVCDAVDPAVFRPLPRDPLLRSRLGIPEGRRVVAFLGLLNAYQGVDALLEAAVAVVRRKPDTHFLIMGYPHVEVYEKRAADLGITPHVSFPGRVPYFDAAAYLALADVAVAPKLSASEANGKVLNYMACSLPVVVFDRPVDREILGDAGVFAPRGDTEALADLLLELLADNGRCLRLAQKGRERIDNQFSWHRVGAELERTIELALALQ
ncbi:MAG: glycosyltransferase [Candidatus Schekmanbacteria bacterium]|nr:glycosyltransferase [Candidatus Schekmanbacteria bacterium]